MADERLLAATRATQGEQSLQMQPLVTDNSNEPLLHGQRNHETEARRSSVGTSSPSTKPFMAKRQQLTEVFTVRGWVWEFLGLALATLSLVGAIALLLVYRDKPVPKWRVGITLNAILSIASTLYRGGLAVPIAAAISQFGWLRFDRGAQAIDRICSHDYASRGPMGSLLFLRVSNFT